MEPLVGVLAYQGDVLEHCAALEAAGARPLPVRYRRDLDRVAGLVLPGGESTTLGRLLTRFGLLEGIRERAEQGMPVFGTCAGLILLARDIEGSTQPRLGLLDVSVARNAYGPQVESFEAELAVPALPGGPVPAVFIRAPQVSRVGDGVEVLARFEGLPVLLRQGKLLGATFHPELTADRRIHRYFVGLCTS